MYGCKTLRLDTANAANRITPAKQLAIRLLASTALAVVLAAPVCALGSDKSLDKPADKPAVSDKSSVAMDNSTSAQLKGVSANNALQSGKPEIRAKPRRIVLTDGDECYGGVNRSNPADKNEPSAFKVLSMLGAFAIGAVVVLNWIRKNRVHLLDAVHCCTKPDPLQKQHKSKKSK